VRRASRSPTIERHHPERQVVDVVDQPVDDDPLEPGDAEAGEPTRPATTTTCVDSRRPCARVTRSMPIGTPGVLAVGGRWA
jgi:hypothetical protein